MSRTTTAKKLLNDMRKTWHARYMERVKLSAKLVHIGTPMGTIEDLLATWPLALPQYPTLDWARETRDELTRYAGTPVKPSFCGLEDAEGYHKDAAREDARVLTTAIRILKWGKS